MAEMAEEMLISHMARKRSTRKPHNKPVMTPMVRLGMMRTEDSMAERPCTLWKLSKPQVSKLGSFRKLNAWFLFSPKTHNRLENSSIALTAQNDRPVMMHMEANERFAHRELGISAGSPRDF